MGRSVARKVIETEFSVDGMKRLVTTMRKYNQRVKHANATFVRRLMEEGFDVAQMHIQSCNHYDRDKPIGTLSINTETSGDVVSMSLKFTGEQVLFVEFGAGFYWNTKENPLADQFGYGVGTYPNQIHANDEGGWSYQDSTGRWIHTMGTEATMPMYNASVAMRNKEKLISIAKEVYQGVI